MVVVGVVIVRRRRSLHWRPQVDSDFDRVPLSVLDSPTRYRDGPAGGSRGGGGGGGGAGGGSGGDSAGVAGRAGSVPMAPPDRTHDDDPFEPVEDGLLVQDQDGDSDEEVVVAGVGYQPEPKGSTRPGSSGV